MEWIGFGFRFHFLELTRESGIRKRLKSSTFLLLCRSEKWEGGKYYGKFMIKAIGPSFSVHVLSGKKL